MPGTVGRSAQAIIPFMEIRMGALFSTAVSLVNSQSSDMFFSRHVTLYQYSLLQLPLRFHGTSQS